MTPEQLEVHRVDVAYPPRFKNHEDAIIAMECMCKGDPIPKDIYVHPFHLVGPFVAMRDEYKNAPYEIAFLNIDKEPI
jgi:hypothetical protein